MEDKLNAIIETLGNLTIVETLKLSKMLQEKWGWHNDLTTTVVKSSDNKQQPIEEKKEFSIELSEVGDKKIQVIKIIRTLTGLGLKEAKDIADNTPKILKSNVAKEEAESIKSQLEEQGAKVSLL